MVFRLISGLMAALLAFAVSVNFNDPDPIRWVAMYGAACVVSIAAAVLGGVPPVVPALVGVVAIVWAAAWARRVPSLEVYTHMFDEWEMKSETVEEARETCGLLIVAVWMAAVALHSWRAAG
jgi:transmembrane protein TMEM220